MQADPLTDHLAGLIDGLGLPDLQTALLQMHAPSPDTDPGHYAAATVLRCVAWCWRNCWHTAWRCCVCRQRVQQHRAPILQADSGLTQAFLEQLPFQLTAAQQRCCDEISAELCSELPMTHLLQGDVVPARR